MLVVIFGVLALIGCYFGSGSDNSASGRTSEYNGIWKSHFEVKLMYKSDFLLGVFSASRQPVVRFGCGKMLQMSWITL